MYKSKLQELCRRRRWELPEYDTVKDGPDHMPRFTATVNVRGQVFETPAHCRSAKEAQNTAARIAFEHFSVTSPPPVQPQPSSVNPQVQRQPSSANPQIQPRPSSANPQFQAVPSSAPLPTVPPVSPTPELQPVAAVSPLPVSPLPSSLPIPPPGLLVAKNDANTKPANSDKPQQNCEDTIQTPMVYRIAISSHDKSYKETLHLYKNRLQQYAQKQNLVFPVYTSEAEGPPHVRRFKSRVLFDGKVYETVEFFPTMKEAEQAAAKVACQALSIDATQEDGGLYKNLLQEFAQRRGLLCPSYRTVNSGPSHMPVFMSTVEVGSDTFRGAEAKTKKQAEMEAARVAYYALTGSPATESASVIERAVADNLTKNSQPTAMIQNYENAMEEEAEIHAKRAKFSPENVNVNVNAHLSGQSHSNSPPSDSNLPSGEVENSASAERPAENQPSLHRKTVVVPRKSSMPIPDGASVMPYSDDQWVAYKVELQQEPTA
ncbi:hypothetical protein CDL12_29859 [Handroanthus impetiginosus]|uniref:DRBM domain-containing protein n=1 Tax=Handroanthus impetiginosus TaxID=429701 RepID=A0A2G9FX80_9LAMI|nr:hypothetical protein CDL12_29859 [Handroanthus impetiginosus]